MFVSVESVAVCCPGHGYCSESCKRWIRLGRGKITFLWFVGVSLLRNKGKGGKGKGKGKGGKGKRDDGMGPFAKVVEDSMDELRMCFAPAGP